MSTMSMSMRGPPQPPVQQPPASPSSHKRPRPPDLHDPLNQPPADDPFHHEDGEDGDDDDEEDGGSGPKPKNDKKAGRRKIKIEFIQDKSRRHITFSKRKAGIMKKAYELSTLTGTQVLLLVVSETGLVYTFTTAKLQPLVTQPEGKNLIQACLNAPNSNAPPNQAPPNRRGGVQQQQVPPQVPPTIPIPGGPNASPTSSHQQPPNQNVDGGDDDKSPTSPPSKRTRNTRNRPGSPAQPSPQQQPQQQPPQQQQQQGGPYHPDIYGAAAVLGHHPGLIPGYHMPGQGQPTGPNYPPQPGQGQAQQQNQWAGYGQQGQGARR